MNAGHRSICRYSSKDSQNYILVESALRELAPSGAFNRRETSSAYDQVNLSLGIFPLIFHSSIVCRETIASDNADTRLSVPGIIREESGSPTKFSSTKLPYSAPPATKAAVTHALHPSSRQHSLDPGAEKPESGHDISETSAPERNRTITVRIHNLKYKASSPDASKGTFSGSIQLRADTEIHKLPLFLLQKYPGESRGYCNYGRSRMLITISLLRSEILLSFPICWARKCNLDYVAGCVHECGACGLESRFLQPQKGLQDPSRPDSGRLL